MLETPQQFERRTGKAYRPDPALKAFGRPLKGDEALRTQFRFPGACGMASFLGLDASPPTLGPVGQEHAWLTDQIEHSFSNGARHFGTLAVLQPLRFGPLRGEYDRPPIGKNGETLPVWAFPNRPVTPDDAVVWIPATLSDLPWDFIADASDLPDVSTERDEATEQLRRYREELSALKGAGAVPVAGAWSEISLETRQATLERHRVPPVWTPR